MPRPRTQEHTPLVTTEEHHTGHFFSNYSPVLDPHLGIKQLREEAANTSFLVAMESMAGCGGLNEN